MTFTLPTSRAPFTWFTTDMMMNGVQNDMFCFGWNMKPGVMGERIDDRYSGCRFTWETNLCTNYYGPNNPSILQHEVTEDHWSRDGKYLRSSAHFVNLETLDSKLFLCNHQFWFTKNQFPVVESQPTLYLNTELDRVGLGTQVPQEALDCQTGWINSRDGYKEGGRPGFLLEAARVAEARSQLAVINEPTARLMAPEVAALASILEYLLAPPPAPLAI